MAHPPLAGIRIHLNFQTLGADPAFYEALVNSILTLGPTSSLAQTLAVKNELANLGSVNTVCTLARKTAAASGAQHKLDVAAQTKAQGDLDKSVNLLRVLTESGAVTAADVKAMGFVPYEGPPPTPDFVPPVVEVEYGKKGSGKATPFAVETGTAKPDYAVETSLDGATNWTKVIGGRKTRKLTGATGTKIWVHFALLRGTQQSEFSAPVLITFP